MERVVRSGTGAELLNGGVLIEMNNSPDQKRVAYIVSMKHGLPAFTHREIVELKRLGLEVDCFVMRDGEGSYMPLPDWHVVRVNWFEMMAALLWFVLRRPLVFAGTVRQALADKGLIHLMIALCFLKHLKARNVEVIYCNEGMHALWIGYYCTLFTGLPLVVIVHAEMVGRNIKVDLTRKCVDQCQKVITISEYNKKHIMAQFGLADDRVEVIRLFADFKQSDELKVLIVGVWAERKGHETLLRAIREPGLEGYKVWVAGGGNWGDEGFDVAGYVKENHLEDQVVIWGKVSEEHLKLLYQSCDIFCLPSKTSASGVKEGLPVALMEGMFFGKPVVSTYHTGIPELVPEILIEENDHLALAEGLRRLGSAELRHEMGERNRRIVMEQYSKANVRRIAEILSDGKGETA